MKNKIFAVALVAMMLVSGLVLTACRNENCPGDGKCQFDIIGAFNGGCENWGGGVTDCFGTNNPNYKDRCKC